MRVLSTGVPTDVKVQSLLLDLCLSNCQSGKIYWQSIVDLVYTALFYLPDGQIFPPLAGGKGSP